MIYWLTGQPGSGKTTLAGALKKELESRGFTTVHLDGEALRRSTANFDYSKLGRMENVRKAQALAAKLHASGAFVIASFVSPFRAQREEFKKGQDVLEIYVHTTERRGREEHFFTNYEPPLEDFIDVDTTFLSPEQCVRQILEARRMA